MRYWVVGESEKIINNAKGIEIDDEQTETVHRPVLGGFWSFGRYREPGWVKEVRESWKASLKMVDFWCLRTRVQGLTGDCSRKRKEFVMKGVLFAQWGSKD